MHETYQNWHLWVEIGSMYAGFFAHGDDTKCPSEAVWQEMIHGKWVNLPDDALTCSYTTTTTTSTTRTTTTTTTSTITTSTTTTTTSTTTTTTTSASTTTVIWNEEDLIYKYWTTQGFHTFYQTGTPDEIWELLVRDLKWIKDQLYFEFEAYRQVITDRRKDFV